MLFTKDMASFLDGVQVGAHPPPNVFLILALTVFYSAGAIPVIKRRMSRKLRLKNCPFQAHADQLGLEASPDDFKWVWCQASIFEEFGLGGEILKQMREES